MQNFEFYNPTRIIFGHGTIAQLDSFVPSSAHVLVLYGGGSVKGNGTLDEVILALGDRKVSFFSGVEPNPTYETLMMAVEQIRRDDIDFLLAVGGGSVIDGTKFIAAAVNFEGDPWQIMETHGAVVKEAMPFASVLTLPATGSEMNSGAVITRKSIQAKLSFSSQFTFPVFSILDPTKTMSLPERQIANGIADAFVHVIEQYLTYPMHAEVQDRFAESLLQTLVEIGPYIMKNPQDYDARANLMWVATQALNGLIGAGVAQDWTTHMIGHELTALYGIDHARTLAMVLPSLLVVERENKRAKLLQYAKRVWQLTEGTEDEKIDMAIRQTQLFFEALGIKTSLADYDLNSESIDKVITQLEQHGMTQLGENGTVDLTVVRKILEHSLHNKL